MNLKLGQYVKLTDRAIKTIILYNIRNISGFSFLSSAELSDFKSKLAKCDTIVVDNYKSTFIGPTCLVYTKVNFKRHHLSLHILSPDLLIPIDNKRELDSILLAQLGKYNMSKFQVILNISSSYILKTKNIDLYSRDRFLNLVRRNTLVDFAKTDSK